MVRAIDVKNKKIYITTPLSLVDLVRVNTIIRGSSNIPQQIFTEQITKVHNSVKFQNCNSLRYITLQHIHTVVIDFTVDVKIMFLYLSMRIHS